MQWTINDKYMQLEPVSEWLHSLAPDDDNNNNDNNNNNIFTTGIVNNLHVATS